MPKSTLQLPRPAMRPRVRVAAIVLALFFLTATLSACGAAPPSHNVSVVLGAHSNVALAPFGGATETAVRQVADAGGRLSLVISDGDPTVDFSADLPGVTGTSASRQPKVDDALRPFVKAYHDAHASSAESDLLAAINTAARSLSGMQGEKEIVVLDPGLSTSGVMQFQRGLLNATPDDVVAQLKARKSLPTLKGIRLTLLGLGSVSSPQSVLPMPSQRSLETIWVAVLQASGGQVTLTGSPGTPRALSGLPPVTVVPIAAEVALTVPADKPNPGSTSKNRTIGVVKDSTVGFIPDSALFRNRGDALKALRQVAATAINQHWGLHLEGTTASAGSEKYHLRLSRQRAEAVASLLRELGVPADQITLEGVGTHFKEFVPDRNPDGSLDPTRAAQNRTVRIQRR